MPAARTQTSSRRRFLHRCGASLLGGLAATAGSPLSFAQQPEISVPPAPAGGPSNLKITAVRIIHPRSKEPENYWGWLQNTVIANPMSIYPEYKAKRSSWRSESMRSLWVEIETNQGIKGWGKAAGGGAAAFIIEEHFRGLLLGENPLNVERLWDILFRASLPYGRGGVTVMAISAIDLALWDIAGKAHHKPVYQLLGGPTKDRIPTYATGNDVEWYPRFGYKGVKLAAPYGPADGLEGMRKNEALIKKSRETLGGDLMLMLDCYMAWDADYTIEMAKRLEPYDMYWIEESLPPDDYWGYRRINRDITSTRIATGEHEYTRWGFRRLLDYEAADILQPDINWCGGLTEIRRIAAMAAERDIPVIPHQGGTVWGLHFIMTTANAPFAESIGPSRQIEAERRSLTRAVTLLPEPDGYVLPSGEPGFGLDLEPFLQ